MASLLSVNLANPRKEAFASSARGTTGIDKRPASGPVEVRDPGPKTSGLGSGIVGDHIGDGRHHGGRDQALYAFAREDLDYWQERLHRPVPNGFFGENLTTEGLDVNAALIGERWQLGRQVVVQVTDPRIPCATFRGWVGEKGWLKSFTEVARPGTYLRVITPGTITAGDPIEVVHRPHHDVTVSMVYRALTTERERLPHLLTAGEDLTDDVRELAEARELVQLDE